MSFLIEVFGASLILLAFQQNLEPAQDVGLSEEEVAIVLGFSPLPVPPPDPTNAVYESAAAKQLGHALFYDERLSGPGTVSCATCHDPEKSWTDGRELAQAVAHLPRHTMTLWNVAHSRWFFWDGRKDTLWSQALAPLEDPREHASSRLQVAHTIASDADYSRAYAEVFGPLPNITDQSRFPPEGRPVPGEPEHPHAIAWESMAPDDREIVDRIFTNVGKSLAAFERDIISGRSPFDIFVEGLREGDFEKQRALDQSARRGLKLFIGKARCHLCHDGPNFTDLEFHDNRVPISEEGADLGRRLGIRMVKNDPFNCSGQYADDGGNTGRTKLAFPDAHGTRQFKTPTLRNVARTSPYMHEGQFASLQEVVEFYSTLQRASPESMDSERLIEPLGLSAAEKADLVAFLESLTDEGISDELRRPPLTPYLPPD